MNNYKRFSSAAFTLIELSFVILIIGVLIAAIVLGKNLISRSKISNAQTLAQSSSVLSIPELRMWIETSLDRSFKPNEMVDGGSITTWNDINPIASKVSVSSVGSGPNRPTYSTVHTINSIPGVWFQNSASDYLKIDDASFLNNTDYTICVSEKRESNAAGNYFIGDTTVTTSNQNLLLGYLADGTVIHSQAGTTVAANTNTYSSSVELFASSKLPRVFCFIQDSVAGKKSTYINGILAATSNNTSKLSNITSLSIGRSYSGVIGEVIIFTKALNLAEINTVKDSFFANLFISEAFAQTNNISEMQSVMGYMGKKLIIPIAPKGTTCIGGTVTGSTCDITTCAVTTANVTQSSVNQGSGALTCNAGYSGSPTYTCASGTFTPGGSACTGISCPVSVTGVSSPSSVGYAATSTPLTCNAAGYTGSVNYTCTTGTLSVTGSCSAITCPVSITGVSSPSSVGYTATPTNLTCNVAGYSGTVSYTCTTGSLSTTGSCTMSCSAGYVNISGTCQYFGTVNFTCKNSGSSANLPPSSCSSPLPSAFSSYYSYNSSNGVQSLTIPKTGIYRIGAYGGMSSNNGNGSPVSGTSWLYGGTVIAECNFTEGQILEMVVGANGYQIEATTADGSSDATGGSSWVTLGSGSASSIGSVVVFAGHGNARGDCGYNYPNNCGYNNNYLSAATIFNGLSYNRSGDYCYGGFGGGICTDDAMQQAMSNTTGTCTGMSLINNSTNSSGSGMITIILLN